jgi:hypothetical protein
MEQPDLSTKMLFEHIKNQTASKNKIKKNVYNKLLEKIQQKIYKSSTNDVYSIFFEIPKFIIGQATYNLTECAEYIMNTLNSNGFKVKLFNKQELKELGIKKPNSAIIYISWEHLKNLNNTEPVKMTPDEKYIYINNKRKS